MNINLSTLSVSYINEITIRNHDIIINAYWGNNTKLVLSFLNCHFYKITNFMDGIVPYMDIGSVIEILHDHREISETDHKKFPELRAYPYEKPVHFVYIECDHVTNIICEDILVEGETIHEYKLKHNLLL